MGQYARTLGHLATPVAQGQSPSTRLASALFVNVVLPPIPPPNREAVSRPAYFDIRKTFVLGFQHGIHARKPELRLPLALLVFNVQVHAHTCHATKASTMNLREYLRLTITIKVNHLGIVIN